MHVCSATHPHARAIFALTQLPDAVDARSAAQCPSHLFAQPVVLVELHCAQQ